MKSNIAKVAWKSPSNIAFVKYWGKTENQTPRNPSLSLTLEKCHTTTYITLKELKGDKPEVSFEFYFQGKKEPEFAERIGKYLNSLRKILPTLNNYHFVIESGNSFPHSAGIASSASAMSALALCLLTIEQRLGKVPEGDFYTNASGIARLGSGSAARSIFGEYATWGKYVNNNESSDEYASPLKFKMHEMFQCVRDTILIIDNSKKKISSSAGHALMVDHPFAEQRFSNARHNLNELILAMHRGDFENFARILELEALSLHAMMLTANPWYTLLAPNSLIAIQRIRDFRNETNVNVTFTLDAGPNVHVIYPAQEDEKVKSFIETELLPLTLDNTYILDNIGMGPEMLIDEFK